MTGVVRDRLAVASRALAAICGGYLLAALVTALMAAGLPLARAEAAPSATLLSFTIYACAVLWVFAARSAWRAWLGLLTPSLVIAALLYAMDRLPWSAA
ncbi:putative membrane protein [Janthinobacterium agaricidamnosum NBRC 102515 = DSM 9628]|uniref:Putative membrane protein n=1 Tax=Janthinobacterium agaricidamnosum NBRC 102515 = DSM 9628 TaxID=1349767 RepID=W0V370_9BURK|nr:putative membrane protein [Janthinobacterium agaricidamnosum NBRC 102515 = DSM 9628]